MDTIKDRLAAAKKAKVAETLSSQKWEPKEGQPLEGEYTSRQTVTSPGTGFTFDILVVRNDTGLWNTIVPQGTFNLASRKPVKGDLVSIDFHMQTNVKEGKTPFMESTVTFYPVGNPELPF